MSSLSWDQLHMSWCKGVFLSQNKNVFSDRTSTDTHRHNRLQLYTQAFNICDKRQIRHEIVVIIHLVMPVGSCYLKQWLWWLKVRLNEGHNLHSAFGKHFMENRVLRRSHGWIFCRGWPTAQMLNSIWLLMWNNFATGYAGHYSIFEDSSHAAMSTFKVSID